MAQEQVFVRDDLGERPVLVVVDGEIGGVGAADLGLVVGGGFQVVNPELFQKTEQVAFDLRPLRHLFALQVAVDAFTGDPGVADGGGQQVRLDGVAADEMPFLDRRLVERIRVHQATAVVEVLEAGEVTGLPGGADDQAAFDIEFLAFLDRHFAAFPFDGNDAKRLGPAVVAEDHLHRRQAVVDFGPFGDDRVQFVLGRRGLGDRTPVNDPDIGALAPGGGSDVVDGVAEDDHFRMVVLGRVFDVADAPRHRRHVHGGVAGADDQDPAGQVL